MRERRMGTSTLCALAWLAAAGCSGRLQSSQPTGEDAGFTPCTREVPDTEIACTPKTIGPDYDGCTPNDACGPLHGCLLDRYGPFRPVDTVYTAGPADFQPPASAMPSMGTEVTGRVSGWMDWEKVSWAAGSCSYPSAKDLMVGAIDGAEYGSADACGACAEIVGRSGKRVRILIMNVCPECQLHQLDIMAGTGSPYDLLNLPNTPNCSDGAIPVNWKIVPCETEGNVVMYYVNGYNGYGPGVQIRNHRLPLIKLEEYLDGAWYTVNREDYNVYKTKVRGNADYLQPITLRITAIDGATITGTFPAYEADVSYETTSQF